MIIYSALNRREVTMSKLYVRAKSKVELNQRLDAGVPVFGIEYHMGSENMRRLDAMPDGTVISIYSKTYGSTPVAKSYGKWNARKRRVD
jgi:hypothetical protein